MNSCQRLSLSACCRRPAPALPLYEVASPVLLVTMHSQPGRDLALGLRSLPAREGLRRFGRPPKERGGVPAWSSATSAHLSSLPSPVPDPSRLSRRLRSAADTVICSDLRSGAGAPRILHPLVGLGLPFPLSGFGWPWLALAPPLPCRWRFAPLEPYTWHCLWPSFFHKMVSLFPLSTVGILALCQGHMTLAYHASGHLGLIDVGQVGDSPLGLRPSPCMPSYPAMS